MTEAPERPSVRRSRPDIGPFVPPHADGDKKLAGMVSEVLGFDRVGMKDGFLALGGDSLTATLLAVRIQDGFGFAIDPSIIFDSPDLAALAATLERSGRGVEEDKSLTPTVQARPERIPLSSEQQILLWLHQMNDDKAGYNVARAMRIRGTIDPDLLRRALTELLDRHEILRTRLEVTESAPVQIVDPTAGADLEIVDLRAAPVEERERAARRHAGLFVRRPFALDGDKLFRACLVRLAEDEQVLALSMHHLVSDGGSLVLIFSELGALYAALASRKALPRRPSLQYADYTLWQAAAYPRLEDRQVAFWSEYLAGVRETRWLKPAPEAKARHYRLAGHAVSLSPDLTAKLRDLGRSEDVTIAMILFAANQIILAKLCGAEDMVGGMTFSRRTRPEFQDVPGPMIVTYPVRTPIRPDGTFRELLHYVKATLLEAYRHLEIDGVAMARRMTAQSWPMTNFNLVGDRSGPAKRFQESLRAFDPSLGVTDFPTPDAEGGVAPIDFSIELYEEADRITGKILYGLDVFDADFITEIAAYFETLLNRAAVDPACRLAELASRS
ncbi:MAG TPA: condensation domain-containing protein [Alphaproteobacteria bacterium]|nr:condensation domain-containing protein [Alphaproteobacteria bacterium]